MARASLPQNSIAQALRGFAYPLEGLRFISENHLWGVALASIVVNVLLLAGLLTATFVTVVPWLRGVEASIAGWFDFDFWRSTVPVVLWLIAGPLLVAGNALVLLMLGQAVASPFLDVLSERVERLVLGTPETPFSITRAIRSVILGLSDLIWAAMYFFAFNVPIWLVGILIPFLSPVASFASFMVNALLLAQEFVGLPLSRKLVGYRVRWSMVWRNRWLSAGFGTSVAVLLLVPGLNLVLLPLAAAGGALAFCDLQTHGRVPDSALLRSRGG